MFQLDYDPAQLSYADVVRLVCGNRRGGRAYRRQYMEAVFCADAEQAAIAQQLGVALPIERFDRFYLAEDYHQKYYLRHDRVLIAELAGYSPRELIDSTVAARLNGYVGARGGSVAQLRAELPQLGLSAAASAHLERLVAARA